MKQFSQAQPAQEMDKTTLEPSTSDSEFQAHGHCRILSLDQQGRPSRSLFQEPLLGIRHSLYTNQPAAVVWKSKILLHKKKQVPCPHNRSARTFKGRVTGSQVEIQNGLEAQAALQATMIPEASCAVNLLPRKLSVGF